AGPRGACARRDEYWVCVQHQRRRCAWRLCCNRKARMARARGAADGGSGCACAMMVSGPAPTGHVWALVLDEGLIARNLIWLLARPEENASAETHSRLVAMQKLPLRNERSGSILLKKSQAQQRRKSA